MSQLFRLLNQHTVKLHVGEAVVNGMSIKSLCSRLGFRSLKVQCLLLCFDSLLRIEGRVEAFVLIVVGSDETIVYL